MEKGSPTGQKWTSLLEQSPRERITITLVLKASNSYSVSMFSKECSGYDMAPHIIYLQWHKYPHLPESSINYGKLKKTHTHYSAYISVCELS